MFFMGVEFRIKYCVQKNEWNLLLDWTEIKHLYNIFRASNERVAVSLWVAGQAVYKSVSSDSCEEKAGLYLQMGVLEAGWLCKETLFTHSQGYTLFIRVWGAL